MDGGMEGVAAAAYKKLAAAEARRRSEPAPTEPCNESRKEKNAMYLDGVPGVPLPDGVPGGWGLLGFSPAKTGLPNRP
jgi:hypothetical protein